MTNTITYGSLEEALKRLGFAKHVINGHVAFQETTHDALIALPPMPSEQPVLLHHLAMVRITVTGRGVAEEEELEQVMAESAGATAA